MWRRFYEGVFCLYALIKNTLILIPASPIPDLLNFSKFTVVYLKIDKFLLWPFFTKKGHDLQGNFLQKFSQQLPLKIFNNFNKI